MYIFFFFKQKTAYELRISDWSSDVCSSDLRTRVHAMNDVTIIDQFLATFAAYIDSGFGLLQGEVAFLTATLLVIDMTIAGLYCALSHATGQGQAVIAKLLRKVLCVGAFAYTIGNSNWPAGIVFPPFTWLGPP